MDAVTMLRENFIKANKMQKLLKLNKKVMDEVEPLTEVFMSILFKQLQMLFHVPTEDDIMILIKLIREFEIKAIANHCVDVHREVFTALKSASVPIIYIPIDAFPYKVKHERWRNAEHLSKSGAKFSILSDHPVTLQRNTF